MQIIVYKCTKCGAFQTLPENIEEAEPCMFCGGMVEIQE